MSSTRFGAAENSSLWIESAKSLDLLIDAYILCKDSSPFKDPHGKVKDIYKLREGEVLMSLLHGEVRGSWMVVVKF